MPLASLAAASLGELVAHVRALEHEAVSLHNSVIRARGGAHPLLGHFTRFLRQLSAAPLFRHPVVSQTNYWRSILAYQFAVDEFNRGRRARNQPEMARLDARLLLPVVYMLRHFQLTPEAVRARLPEPGSAGFSESQHSRRNRHC